MSPSQRIAIAEKSSRALLLRNATPEAKKKNSEAQRRYWQNCGPEQRAACAKTARDAWAAKTPEQRAACNRKKREGVLRKTPEAIKAQYEKRASTVKLHYPQGVNELVGCGVRAYYANRTPEEAEAWRQAQRKSFDSRSPEKKAQVSDSHKNLWGRRSQDERTRIQHAQLRGRAKIKKPFFSSKMQEMIPCDSSYELRACARLEADSAVVSYARCHFSIPYTFNGVGHLYFPDFLYFTATGACVIVEVKPKQLTYDRIVKAKEAAAIPFCALFDAVFCTWTEKELNE
jgi:hypothetical protein